MRQRVTGCQFNDCTHVHEPGCAVRQAAASGEIHSLRYNSYVRMRLGDLDE
jgi:ribosome biogenesis GTPase